MLDSAIIQKTGLVNGRFNIGKILETILYYDRVHLVVSGGMFAGLWDCLGPDNLRTLFSYPAVTATVMPQHHAVMTNRENGVITHIPSVMRLMGKEGRLLSERDFEGSMFHWVANNPNRKGSSRLEVRKVLKAAKLTSHERTFGPALESQNRTKALACDPHTLKLFIRGTAQADGLAIDESALDASRIQIFDLGEQGLVIDSNIDLTDIIRGGEQDATWGNVLNVALDYASDLYLSQAYGADIIALPETAEVATRRLDLSLQRSGRSAGQVTAFEEMVFETAHPFAEAYNEGWISFSDALKIIDKSKKFRTWTHGLAPDSDLLAEYHAAISRDTILKSLPFSVARFAFFNGGGALLDAGVAPGSGMVVSAFDSFVVDRLIGGWRPNVFVKNMKKALGAAEAKAIASTDRQ